MDGEKLAELSQRVENSRESQATWVRATVEGGETEESGRPEVLVGARGDSFGFSLWEHQ